MSQIPKTRDLITTPCHWKFFIAQTGQGMSSVMTRNDHFRPQSAGPAQRRKSVGPIPGFEQEKVATLLSTVPRVKPEAAQNAQRATGSMATLLAQAPPKARFPNNSTIGNERFTCICYRILILFLSYFNSTRKAEIFISRMVRLGPMYLILTF